MNRFLLEIFFFKLIFYVRCILWEVIILFFILFGNGKWFGFDDGNLKLSNIGREF